MIDLASLLNLPFDTLFTVAVGYLGYRVAYIGLGPASAESSPSSCRPSSPCWPRP